LATKKRGRTIEKVNFTNDLRRSINNLEFQLEDEEKYERFLLDLQKNKDEVMLTARRSPTKL